MRFAYADPPYIGQAEKHYAEDPRCAEVDHSALIERLTAEYPDGWALSAGANLPSLRGIIPHLPDGTRQCLWIKNFASFKPGVNPAWCYEPVYVYRGRKRTREQPTVRDWIMTPITLRRGLHGAKPEPFCFAVFEWLNMKPGDELEDLYPGTGAVSWAWGLWRRQLWA